MQITLSLILLFLYLTHVLLMHMISVNEVNVSLYKVEGRRKWTGCQYIGTLTKKKTYSTFRVKPAGYSDVYPSERWCLDCERKLEHQEETHRERERENKFVEFVEKGLRASKEVFLLRGNSANRCATSV